MSLIHTKLSGTSFNKIYKNKKFIKFLNTELIHYNFQYKLGLNIDVLPFNPSNECSEGGLYFCEESKFHLFWRDYENKLALVTIPNNAQIYIEKDKFKSDKLIIKDITNFTNIPDEFWIDLLDKDGFALKYIKKQTEELCKIAIQENAWVLQYVKEEFLTTSNLLELCKMAVEKNGLVLQYVKKENQTEKLCILAVQQNGNALEYVNQKYQTRKVHEVAVQQNSSALRFVKNWTQELCNLAVQRNIYALRHVKDFHNLPKE